MSNLLQDRRRGDRLLGLSPVSGATSSLSRLLIAGLLAVVPPGAAGAEELILSRETCSGLFLIPLTWSSSKSGESHDLLALFDTGASGHTSIDPDTLERISGRRIAAGERVRLEGIAAGDARFTAFRPRVHELDHVSRAIGRELDVFLSFETFEDFLLILDYPRGELRIARGKLPRPDGVEVFDAGGPDRRPWLEVKIGGRKRKMLIDSGSTGTLTIRPRGALRWKVPPLPVRLALRWDGFVQKEIGRLDETIAVGPLTLERPVVAVTEGIELIGVQVLDRMVVTFDQKRRRVRMESTVEEPVRLPSERGTGAIPWFEGEEAMEVTSILPGTPAEAAGVRVGDRVVAIDGVPVRELACRFRPGGSRAAEQLWTVRRDDDTLEITIGVIDLVP